MDCVGRNGLITDDCHIDPSSNRSLRSVQERIIKDTGNYFVNYEDWLCVSFCPPVIENTAVFTDGLHFTTEFAKKLAPLFRAFLVSNNILDSGTPTTVVAPTSSSIPETESDYAELLGAWQTKIVEGTRLEKVPPAMRPGIDELPNIGYGTFCQLREPDQNISGCTFGNSDAKRTAVILGDSFAAAITPMVVNALDPQKWRTISLSMSSCPVGRDVPSVDAPALSECDRHRFYAFQVIAKIRPEIVILGELPPLEKNEDGKFLPRPNLNSWESGLDDTFSTLANSVRKMIYLGTQPIGGSLIDCVGSNQVLVDSCFVDPTGLNSIRERQGQIMKNRGVLFIDPVEWLCQQTCPPIIDFIPVRRDQFHISVSLAKRLAPLFRAFLQSNNLL